MGGEGLVGAVGGKVLEMAHENNFMEEWRCVCVLKMGEISGCVCAGGNNPIKSTEVMQVTTAGATGRAELGPSDWDGVARLDE